jgi:hypothetical protein
MAVNFKALDDRLKLSPLSDKELEAVAYTEARIDSEIIERFKGHELRFDLYVCNFTRTFDGKTTDWPDARKKLMYEELKKRFNEAGWICKEEIADVHDRYGTDWLVFKGKN